jgi:hypothetical protein
MTPEGHKQTNKQAVCAPDFDMQMLKDNLKRSYAERIRRHQIALNTMRKLQKAKFL